MLRSVWQGNSACETRHRPAFLSLSHPGVDLDRLTNLPFYTARPIRALVGGGSFPDGVHFQERRDLMNIYVGNLAYSVTQDELREAFAAYGDVESANLIMDKFTGESKGFGFVEMPNNSEADAAIKALNEQPMKGRPLRVNQAKPRAERGRGGAGGGRRW